MVQLPDVPRSEAASAEVAGTLDPHLEDKRSRCLGFISLGFRV